MPKKMNRSLKKALKSENKTPLNRKRGKDGYLLESYAVEVAHDTTRDITTEVNKTALRKRAKAGGESGLHARSQLKKIEKIENAKTQKKLRKSRPLLKPIKLKKKK